MTKKVKIKCPECKGKKIVAVGEYCSYCKAKGWIEAELYE